MRHARLVIHRLQVEDEVVPVRFSTLVVVAQDASDGVDWEVVAESTAPVVFDMRRHHLQMVAVTGADGSGALEFGSVAGDAVVVRFVDNTVVFRGDGDLEGFDQSWLL